MSKNARKVSAKAQGEPPRNSVYDFLYHDVKRVASFLAQFDPSGHLQQIKQKEGKRRGSSDKGGLSAGIDIGVARIGFEGGTQVDNGGSEDLERTYDTLWANAITLLDYLASEDMIQKDLNIARMGQFILFSGNLSVQYTGVVQPMWNLPSMAASARLSIDNTQFSPHITKSEIDAYKSGVEYILSIYTSLPHSSCFNIDDSHHKVWGILTEDYISGTSSDVALKYGNAIAGTWAVLGIMDALPDTLVEVPHPPMADVLTDGDGAVKKLIAYYSFVVRRSFGRPPEMYGVTPLLIFRQVAG